MNRVSLSLVLATATLATACSVERILLQEGESSSLAVRVYVDANGNGSFGGPDVPIASVTVTADGQDTQLTQTTDASGLATFSLPPGSYRLSVTAGAPAGAVLATASAPTVVATYQGGELTAEFRYSFLPGGIAGVVFRDDDGDGSFDPAEDTPAAGIQVALFAGSTAEGDPLTDATTDATGAFAFAGLRPGAYVLDFTPFPTIEIVGGNTQSVTVGADGTTDVAVEFTGNLLVSVGDARNADDGDPIAVEGVVTWQAQWDSRQYFVQDMSAGIAVFDGTSPTLTVGDSVRVIGEKGTFRGEVQITNVTGVQVFDNVGEPNPAGVTAAQINAGEFQGRLVTLEATVDSLITDDFENQTVYLSDAAGETFLVYADSRTGVLPDAWVVGEPFSVTGVLGTDDRSDRFPLPHRIEVRGTDDVVQGVSTISIAEARTMDGLTVTVEGVVTWQQEWDATVYFFQDATGGISAFDTNDPTLQRGDRLRIRGEVGSFRGETQLSPVVTITVLGQEAVPTPRTVTAAQVNAGQFQGELVRITGTVDSVQVFGFDNHMVFLTDGFGNTVTAYVDSRNGIASTDWTEGSEVAIAGVLGADNRNNLPFRIEIRDTADRAELSPPITIAAARGMPVGSTVIVEGVVTFLAPDSDPNTRFYYFQDATGGITTFDGSRPSLQLGDRVRVQGDVGAFRGETQIGVSNVQVVGQEAVPTPRVVTAADINAGQFQGELVTITGTVDSLQVLSFDNHNVFLTDGAGATFAVYVDSRVGVGSADWTVGEMLDVTGVLTTDDRNTLPTRIEIRSPADRVIGGTVMTIAAARGMPVGNTVTVEGVVTFLAPDSDPNTRFYYFQDATGGITTFDGSRPALQRGDRVRVQGDVGAFRGELQIGVSGVQVVGREAVPMPRAVTAAEINASQFQGELVTIAGTVDSLQVLNFDNHNVFLTDGAGATFAVYVDSRVGVGSADWTIGEMLQVTGVLTTDDRNPLPTRIEMRDPLDRQ